MISIDRFLALIQQQDLVIGLNEAQHDGICHDGDDILMLVAGPGSGKTTVLVLRALRHMLVDGVLPEQLLLTTFTRKAAKELRTRWLYWGTRLLDVLHADPMLKEWIDQLDLNRCRIDTLDSIAEQTLTEHRLPGQVAPVVVDESAAKLLLKRATFGKIYKDYKDVLGPLLARYTFDSKVPANNGDALSVAKTLCERLVQDRVDLQRYANSGPAHHLMVDILTGYLQRLNDTGLYDFAYLEFTLLQRLQEGSLDSWVSGITAMLIDEYQDTNPLQEAIYFAIITAASPRVTIVGDDDQAMYRFRGGSVELFTRFPERCQDITKHVTRRIDLVVNYRSSCEIVDFYNRHIQADPAFNLARVQPPKPLVTPARGVLGMPVLGLFRHDPVTLANDLSEWLANLLSNRRTVMTDGQRATYELRMTDPGALGDCVLLAHTVEEVHYDNYRSQADNRFAAHLRMAMEQHHLRIFNPRGRALRTIPSVQVLLGLLLLCLDPDEARTAAIYPTREAQYFFSIWRDTATEYVKSQPHPSGNGGLRRFIDDWQEASRGKSRHRFPTDWPVLELLFKLIAWMPNFQNDPEHQVWLEAIARTIANAGMASPYGMQLFRDGDHLGRSRESVIRDALQPIAEDEVRVDEDIMPSVPRDRMQIMTIHQAKGLEFPLVIVDVGSQFKMNHRLQAFRRFPRIPSNVVVQEDDVEQYISTPLRSHRMPLDRTFDDLVRLYYVAYSRPRSVLLLVGCEQCLTYGRGSSLDTGTIPNIALGWNRDGTWPWRQNTGRPAPIRVDPPLLLI